MEWTKHFRSSQVCGIMALSPTLPPTTVCYYNNYISLNVVAFSISREASCVCVSVPAGLLRWMLCSRSWRTVLTRQKQNVEESISSLAWNARKTESYHHLEQERLMRPNLRDERASGPAIQTLTVLLRICLGFCAQQMSRRKLVRCTSHSCKSPRSLHMLWSLGGKAVS